MSNLEHENNLFSVYEFMNRIKESRNNFLFQKNQSFEKNKYKKIKTISITDNNDKLNKFLNDKHLIDSIFDGNKINIIKKPEIIFPYCENNNKFITNKFKKNKRTQSLDVKPYKTHLNKK